ncbi:hypothetical protein [Eggerthella sinensis]|uniref:hypothetical protein n=1 Tax=Eggerthella sinensis TaxID=242230 RepID=UPI00248E2D70|nr:hypothetical protein [Eggerthella sinensis]
MAQPRPSLTLILDIDERLDSEDVRLEIDRCYSYVGPTLVRAHEAGEGAPENIMRFLVKMGTRRYLHAGDEGADELWHDVMERWFYNELYKVSNNMLIYNRRQREVGNPPLVFDWIDVELQNGELHALLHCDNVSGIQAEASSLLTTLRNAYNDGSLGQDVARVYLPEPSSYEQQKAAGAAAKAEREAEEAAARAAAEEEARAAARAAEEAANEAFLESPQLTADCASEEDAPASPEPFALDEPDFALDYRMWLVEYADGSARTFDSHAGTLA